VAHLVVREPGRIALSVGLSEAVRAGRGADNELVLADRQASRNHARFDPDGDGVRVSDAGSRHGTFVNGARIDADGRRLADGDVVQIGNVLITFHAEEAASPGTLSTFAPGHVEGPGLERRRLSALTRVGALVGGELEPRALAGRLLDEALAALPAERGAVVLRELRVERSPDGVELVVPRAHAERLARGRESLLHSGERSAIGAPLLDADRGWGFVWVDARGGFGADDVAFLSALAHLAAAALAQAERARVAEAARQADPLPEILGESPAVRELTEQVRRYARAGDASVLILGESGSGKELVARTLHELSPRRGGPFVALNCAALPEALVESELFGHEKGAFTGAARARPGRFVLAHRGTLFLDEIGDLGLAAQAKLLRVLEDGEVQALGADAPRAVDVRVIAATHRRLADEIAAGRFREDLYYRLAVGEIRVPPLRERGVDVIVLAEAFLARAAARLGKRGLRFSPAALASLRAERWPGNVRQLANEVERAAILGDGPEVDLTLRPTAPAAAAGTLAERFARLDVDERTLVEEALRQANGNASEAARLLGISRAMLRRRREHLED
jgi:DNA-binding NtrC family response regulator